MIKKILRVNLFLLIIMGQMVFAQEKYMEICNPKGKKNIIKISEVDSIKFFETNESVSTVTDIDGNVYKTIKIGDQWWMAENLKVTKYRNGETIQKVTDGTQWSNLDDSETPAYCAYNNYENNAATYGYLYNWYAVDDSRNIAPEGWHVPTDEEWTTLSNFISDNVGTKLKSITGWNSNGNGFDDYGFAGLPAGYRRYDGTFYYMGGYAYFWSASEYTTDSVAGRTLFYDYSGIRRDDYYEESGFSVRCVRD